MKPGETPAIRLPTKDPKSLPQTSPERSLPDGPLDAPCSTTRRGDPVDTPAHSPGRSPRLTFLRRPGMTTQRGALASVRGMIASVCYRFAGRAWVALSAAGTNRPNLAYEWVEARRTRNGSYDSYVNVVRLISARPGCREKRAERPRRSAGTSRHGGCGAYRPTPA